MATETCMETARLHKAHVDDDTLYPGIRFELKYTRADMMHPQAKRSQRSNLEYPRTDMHPAFELGAAGVNDEVRDTGKIESVEKPHW